jgi:hypothetical protein
LEREYGTISHLLVAENNSKFRPFLVERRNHFIMFSLMTALRVTVLPTGSGLINKVGEDNVCMLPPEANMDDINKLCALKDIGRYFSAFDSSRGTFIASPKLVLEYPDL